MTSMEMSRITYRIETPGPAEAMAAKIASDQSTGTFAALPGETEELRARIAARVADIRLLPPVGQPSFPGKGPVRRSFTGRTSISISRWMPSARIFRPS
ncbi:hypothetical protein SAMN05880582_1104 [Rhizobium sp. RU20A]|nr:hypothetical protein SAMN05880582_1104 [Rhizobium sp. RU20A]